MLVRIALGALIIKEKLGTFDEETVEQIRENPYLQNLLGITDYHLEEPFHPTVVGGFGLGLSISLEIVKLHSGEISIISPLSSKERGLISVRDNLPETCINVSLPKDKI